MGGTGTLLSVSSRISPPHRLVIDRLTVEFPGVRALDNVSLGIAPGEVHGIVGENGAGKSTLMRTVAGLQPPNSGRLLLEGEPVAFHSPAEAMGRGLAMIHQELNLVDELSVAENLFLGREPAGRLRLIDRRAMIERARELLQSIGSRIDPRTPLGHLSVAQQQLVEIARAADQNASVLIMDEPTAVLGENESRALFALIRRLRAAGTTVLYISHRLPEVLELCDRVTVLRDGRLVRTLDAASLRQATEKQLASLMVGRPMADHFPARHAPRDEEILRVEGISIPDLIENVGFTVHAGEIFGLAGLVGAGRTETAEAIVGLRKRSRGAIFVRGEPVRVRNVAEAKRAGIAYVSEDRKGAGLTLEMSIAANTTLATLRNYAHPLIDRKAEHEVALAHARNLRTKFGRTGDAVATLSGGNQQKVALAKWLDAKPTALLLDEPTRGVDIGAKEEIYRVIQSLADAGMACLVISSELPELLGLCHRIGVMHEGRLVEVLDAEEATEERIMHAASGLVGV